MLTYDDTYAVEIYDVVDIEIDRHIHSGIVTRLFPRMGEVQVRYADDLDFTRAGNPRIKSRRVSVRQISLVARDG
jgi:hypothetical protein